MRDRANHRRRRLLSFALCFATVAGVSMTPLMNDISLAGTEAARNLVAMLGDRSPGERPEGALLATKFAKAPSPRQYAEPKIRQRPPAGMPAPEALPPAEEALPADGPAVPLAEVAGPLPVAFFGSPPPAPFILPPGGGGSTGGGSTSTGGGSTSSTSSGGDGGSTSSSSSSTSSGSSTSSSSGGDTPPPPPAVPEPAIWLNLIVGFGAIGVLLRRRRRPAQPELQARKSEGA